MKLTPAQKKVLADINATGRMAHGGKSNVWPSFNVLERNNLVCRTATLNVYVVTEEGKKHL